MAAATRFNPALSKTTRKSGKNSTILEDGVSVMLSAKVTVSDDHHVSKKAPVSLSIGVESRSDKKDDQLTKEEILRVRQQIIG